MRGGRSVLRLRWAGRQRGAHAQVFPAKPPSPLIHLEARRGAQGAEPARRQPIRAELSSWGGGA